MDLGHASTPQRTDRHVDIRHAHRNTPLPYWGGVINGRNSWGGFKRMDTHWNRWSGSVVYTAGLRYRMRSSWLLNIPAVCSNVHMYACQTFRVYRLEQKK